MFLDKIREIKKRELDELKKPARDVLARFRAKDFNIIAEVKKASPSKGDIAPDIDPVEVAGNYVDAGAAAISVLTEKEYFKGDKKYIEGIRKKFPDALILRKDFISDPYELYEAKILGADIVLLIFAFTKEKTKDLAKLAHEIGLCVLYEVHDEKEMKEALNCGAEIIGVNNRNLETLEVDIETSKKLSKYITKDRIFIAESGIKGAEDIEFLKNLGYRGALVGESLMRNPELLREIV